MQQAKFEESDSHIRLPMKTSFLISQILVNYSFLDTQTHPKHGAKDENKLPTYSSNVWNTVSTSECTCPYMLQVVVTNHELL